MHTVNVCILGAGIIGAATAYYLSQSGIRCTVVEREGVACAASGKAGGFLAQDWCRGTALDALARRSFGLHAELAETLGADIGYRRLDTYLAHSGVAPAPPEGWTGGWLDGQARIGGRLGSANTTAQVHPGRLTRALVDAAVANGATLKIGAVTGITLRQRKVIGVELGDERLAADAVIIAMGPWSILAQSWLGLAPVGGLKGYSIVLKPSTPVPAEAIFVEGDHGAPEIYPRPDGHVYVCGAPSEDPLPLRPGAISIDADACAQLHRDVGHLSTTLRDAQVVHHQACYRPVTADGLPMIGPIPNAVGAFVATGHNCWGILNGPATGEALAALIATGVSSEVSLAAFDPQRFTPSSHDAPDHERIAARSDPFH